MPLSTALALYFTQPITAAVINYLFNHESLNKLEITSILSAMVGVILMTNPGLILPQTFINEQDIEKQNLEYPYYYLGAFFCLSGSVCSGFAYLYMRRTG